jgi:hypothetical protein
MYYTFWCGLSSLNLSEIEEKTEGYEPGRACGLLGALIGTTPHQMEVAKVSDFNSAHRRCCDAYLKDADGDALKAVYCHFRKHRT